MIEIIDYQERWPQEFLRIGREIKTALGERAVRVDHIGSTSVPDLASKDIIDVQLTLISFAEFEHVRAALVGELGYVFREWVVADHRPEDNARPEEMDGDPEWEKRYFREPDGGRVVHLHVRAAARANQRYALLFRDFLRANDDMANAYAELKRRLAAVLGENIKSYPDVKDPVCDLIIYAAEEWAKKVRWDIGRADI